mgnify:CR=1 FL=1
MSTPVNPLSLKSLSIAGLLVASLISFVTLSARESPEINEADYLNLSECANSYFFRHSNERSPSLDAELVTGYKPERHGHICDDIMQLALLSKLHEESISDSGKAAAIAGLKELISDRRDEFSGQRLVRFKVPNNLGIEPYDFERKLFTLGNIRPQRDLGNLWGTYETDFPSWTQLLILGFDFEGEPTIEVDDPVAVSWIDASRQTNTLGTEIFAQTIDLPDAELPHDVFPLLIHHLVFFNTETGQRFLTYVF